MANAAVLKTAVRKDLGVRIPRPPLKSAHRPTSNPRLAVQSLIKGLLTAPPVPPGYVFRGPGMLREWLRFVAADAPEAVGASLPCTR
jgi:hypothetical protein